MRYRLDVYAMAFAVACASPAVAGEGALNMVVWEGYAQDDWVKPFEQQTGCMVNHKYAGSSDEMVALMRQGGSQYDLVSASGDASLRLIFGHNVAPIDIQQVPAWKDLVPDLQSPAFNTVHGTHFGISYEWGPNILLWNAAKITTTPKSWSALYDPANAGQITVPDNAIQIADAALYLSHTQPALGISDPYELNAAQMDAVVALLQKQKPLLKKYWALASDEVDLFRNGDASIGAAWPYMTNTLREAGAKVAETIPDEGATGWADSWMVPPMRRILSVPWRGSISSPRRMCRRSRRCISERRRRTPKPAQTWIN